MKKDYYTINEVAEILRVSPLTVRTWVKNEKIKAVKIDRLIRIPKEELEPKKKEN